MRRRREHMRNTCRQTYNVLSHRCGCVCARVKISNMADRHCWPAGGTEYGMWGTSIYLATQLQVYVGTHVARVVVHIPSSISLGRSDLSVLKIIVGRRVFRFCYRYAFRTWLWCVRAEGFFWSEITAHEKWCDLSLGKIKKKRTFYDFSNVCRTFLAPCQIVSVWPIKKNPNALIASGYIYYIVVFSLYAKSE